MKNLIFIILILCSGCGSISKKESKSESIEVSKIEALSEKTRQINQEHQRKNLDLIQFRNFIEELNLTPIDTTKPSINRIFRDGKEVFRQEVENAKYIRRTQKTDTIILKDTIYIYKENQKYKQKYDSINIAIENIKTEKKEKKRKATPWWLYFILGLISPYVFRLIISVLKI